MVLVILFSFGSPVRSRELDSILMGPFPLEIYGPVIPEELKPVGDPMPKQRINVRRKEQHSTMYQL